MVLKLKTFSLKKNQCSAHIKKKKQKGTLRAIDLPQSGKITNETFYDKLKCH